MKLLPPSSIFREAYKRAEFDVRALAKRDESDLLSLIGKPASREIEIQGKKLTLTRWVASHPERGSLAIITEIRRTYFLVFSRVTCFGVYLSSGGLLREFAEQDYYSHGY